MAGENKPMSYEERHQESLKKEEEKKERMEKLRKDTIARLQSDPAIKEYLSQFSSYSVETFINGYANKLMLVLEYANMYIDMHERSSTEYMKRADKCLTEIQLKKLFDLRCRWGANLIKIDGIEVSSDFYIEARNIMNSKIVPPITQEEFDLYLEYVRSHHFHYHDYPLDWMDVENVRSENMKQDDLPEWFVYHNIHTGSNIHLQLPDLRGDKESEYCMLWHKEEKRKQDAKIESGEVKPHVPDERPRISDYQYNDVLQFMKKFEKPETVRLFESYVEFGGGGMIKEDEDDSEWLDEQVETIIHTLSTMGEVRLPIEANRDWRRGLIAAWEKFEKEQVVTALPAAYDNYLFMLENKIAFPKEDDLKWFSDTLKKQILGGRELNGEPRDFDF